MSKILTDDLILERLADNNVYPPEDLDYDKKINDLDKKIRAHDQWRNK